MSQSLNYGCIYENRFEYFQVSDIFVIFTDFDDGSLHQKAFTFTNTCLCTMTFLSIVTF